MQDAAEEDLTGTNALLFAVTLRVGKRESLECQTRTASLQSTSGLPRAQSLNQSLPKYPTCHPEVRCMTALPLHVQQSRFIWCMSAVHKTSIFLGMLCPSRAVSCISRYLSMSSWGLYLERVAMDECTWAHGSQNRLPSR